MSCPAADTFHEAAEVLAGHPLREGNLLAIPAGARLTVGGDLHGNRTALGKLIQSAELGAGEGHLLILQEIVHGPADERAGVDRSVEALLRAARTLTQHPGQVLMLMGNHDVSEVTGNEITKDGRRSCEEFARGVEYAYRDDAGEVLAAVHDLLRQLPLAARTPGGVFLSHSVPAPSRTELAGHEIFSRPYAEEDFHRGGPVYEWTWGRGQTPEQLQRLAEDLAVGFFVLGHRLTPTGWERIGDLGVTLACDHDRGAFLRFAADESLEADTLDERVGLLAGVH